MPHKTHLKLLPILGLAAALLPIPSLLAKAAPDKQSSLAWPPVTAQTRPWARWWWMGSAVDAVNLDRELARYQAAGLGGVEVTPIYGVHGWEDRDISYLTPKWMEMLDHTIASASRLGMKTDMTTGTGWCFGGSTVSATDANAVVVVTVQQVRPGTPIAGTGATLTGKFNPILSGINDMAANIQPGATPTGVAATLTGTFDPATTQALVAFSQDGKSLDLTSRIGRDGRVDWTPEGGPWQVYAISQKPSGQMVKRSAPGGAGPMLNPFYPAAMTRYLQWFEKPFAAAKPNLGALFQDSYEYQSQWAPDFLAQFEKLRGYPLQTELPALFGDARDDHTSRVKSDYRETISDIMTLESMPIWVKWAHAHGYLARYQAHGDPGNLLDLYAVADIPETEMFFKSRSMLVSKFASSAAHVTGKNIASAETGTWLEEHFTETLADMKYLVDQMFLAGINKIIYHGTAYSPDEAPWPGWCFYASTEMNPRNSIWRDVPTLNAYITRCQSILQSGNSDNDILIYWPIYDRWSDPQGMVEHFKIEGQWFQTEPIGKTAHHLWDRGYAFDYVSDHQLATVKPGHDTLLMGASRYRAIVVPPCTLMPVETLKQLQALAAGGVPVIFDTKLPDDVPGLHDLDTRRQAFKTLLAAIKPTPHVFVGDVDTGLNAAGIDRESMTDHPGLSYVRRSYPGGLHYFITNRGEQPLDDWITLSTKARSIELMDPMTGETGLAQTKPTNNGDVQVHLQLDPGHSILLRTFTKTAETGPAFPLHTYGTPIALTGTWSVKFIAGGPTLPAPLQTDKLDSWTTLGGPDAQAFAGTALYSLTFDAPPGQTGPFSIDLGRVCQSARVRLNGKPLGTLIIPPFRIEAPTLLPKANLLEVEVTNVSANRIRDLDIRHVPWKIFYPPNVLSVHYRPLDASGWHLTDSGLDGPVTLDPVTSEN